MFVNWRSGNEKLALTSAIHFAEKATPKAFLFGYLFITCFFFLFHSLQLHLHSFRWFFKFYLLCRVKFEVIHLLFIALLLHDQQQYSLATKLYEIGNLLHSRICHLSPLSSSSSALSAFICNNISSCNSSSPSSNLLATPTKLESVTSFLLSLVSNFYSSSSSSLLSLKGMHLLFKSLSSLCPPSASLYQLFPLAHPESNTLFSPQSLLDTISNKPNVNL